MLLKYFQKSENFTRVVPVLSWRVLEFVIFIHLITSAMMFTAPEIFETNLEGRPKAPIDFLDTSELREVLEGVSQDVHAASGSTKGKVGNAENRAADVIDDILKRFGLNF
jgi:hypothetical protein